MATSEPSTEAGPPPLPSVPPPRRSRFGLIAIGIGAAVVVAGGGALLLRILSAPPLPVPLARLPEETTRIESIDTDPTLAAELEMRIEDVPDEARWSNVSTLCGGTDLFHALLDPTYVGGTDKLAELLADKDEAKATLACGKAVMQGSPKKSRGYVLTLRLKHVPHTIAMVRFDGKDLPDTTKLMKSAKAPDHLEAVRCKHDANEADAPKPMPEEMDPFDDRHGDAKKHRRDPDADCIQAVAKIEHEPLWLIGDMQGLRGFGDGYSPEAKNKIDNADLIMKELGGLSGTQIMVGTGDDVAALPSVSDEEIRDKSFRVLRDVKVWGSAVTYDGPFVRGHQEYQATKESDAKDIAEVLERYFKEMKRELKDADEAASEDKSGKDAASNDDPAIPERDKLRAAVRKLEWHSVEDVVIDRSGVVVTVDMKMTPDSSDKAAWKAYADVNKARAKNAAAIIDALIAGNDPSEDDEKALSPKLHATLHPPESVPVDGFGDLRIPGGGRCFSVDATTASCAFPKWDKPTTSEKVKASVTKAGFAITPGASDATLLATKGESAVIVDIYGTKEKGSHVTLTMQPPKAAP